MIDTMPNLHRAAIRSCHRFDLPRMCPVSGNPQPGSTIDVWYTAAARFLEVQSLGAYIESYIGGRGPIRDMEQTIQQIAQDCAAAVKVAVVVVAHLKIDDRSAIRDYRVIVKAKP